MAHKADKIGVWERQPKESSQAYEAFAAYRDMGADRSLRAVTQKLSKSYTLISRWSRERNWVERARAWDNDLTRQAKEDAAKKLKDMNTRHIGMALQLQNKALEALKKIDISEFQPREILAFIKEAAAMERQNRLEDAGLDSEGRDANGSKSLADSIVEAYSLRKGGDGND